MDIYKDHLDEDDTKPMILNANDEHHYNNAEIVDDNMSLENMEKDMINRALKKHASKRKEAAEDLGISERTLYRKIKQYDIAL